MSIGQLPVWRGPVGERLPEVAPLKPPKEDRAHQPSGETDSDQVTDVRRCQAPRRNQCREHKGDRQRIECIEKTRHLHQYSCMYYRLGPQIE